MKLPYLQLSQRTTSFTEFIDFWQHMYFIIDKKSHMYDAPIKKKSFTKADIRNLFEWKNYLDYRNNQKKKKVVDGIVKKTETVNLLKRKFDRKKFENEFGHIGAIWQIFLMHIIDPRQFPIFDQHVYRAHMYIEKQEIMEIPSYKKSKLLYYNKIYKPFYDQIMTEKGRYREFDKAMWIFGKFLKTGYAQKLTTWAK